MNRLLGFDVAAVFLRQPGCVRTRNTGANSGQGVTARYCTQPCDLSLWSFKVSEIFVLLAWLVVWETTCCTIVWATGIAITIISMRGYILYLKKHFNWLGSCSEWWNNVFWGGGGSSGFCSHCVRCLAVSVSEKKTGNSKKKIECR